MRILIYGAGVIGSTYVVYLSRSGCEVTVLALGHRLEALCQNGLLTGMVRLCKKKKSELWNGSHRMTGTTISF